MASPIIINKRLIREVVELKKEASLKFPVRL